MILHKSDLFTIAVELCGSGEFATVSSEYHGSGESKIDRVVLTREDLIKMLAMFDDKEGM